MESRRRGRVPPQTNVNAISRVSLDLHTDTVMVLFHFPGRLNFPNASQHLLKLTKGKRLPVCHSNRPSKPRAELLARLTSIHSSARVRIKPELAVRFRTGSNSLILFFHHKRRPAEMSEAQIRSLSLTWQEKGVTLISI
jgi:hypothetical protein